MIFVYTKGKYRHCFADLFIISQLVSNVRFKTGPWGIKGDENFSFLPASISPAVKSVTAFTCLYMARLLMNQRSPRTSTYTKHLYFDVGLTRHWSWKCSHINTPPPLPHKKDPTITGLRVLSGTRFTCEYHYQLLLHISKFYKFSNFSKKRSNPLKIYRSYLSDLLNYKCSYTEVNAWGA